MNSNESTTIEYLSEEEKYNLSQDAFKLSHHAINIFVKNKENYDLEELEGIVFEAFSKALTSFDKSRNYKFSTYFFQIARSRLQNYLKKENERRKSLRKSVSLQDEVYNDSSNNASIQDIIEDENAIDMDKSVMQSQLGKLLTEALIVLNEEETEIITSRFEMFTDNIATQQELADKYDLSQAKISKIQKVALEKMLRYLSKKYPYISDYLTMDSF